MDVMHKPLVMHVDCGQFSQWHLNRSMVVKTCKNGQSNCSYQYLDQHFVLTIVIWLYNR